MDKTLGHIASKARSAGIVVTEADRRKLDAMSQTDAHQGRNRCAPSRSTARSDMLAIAAGGEAPFLVLCDEISDPTSAPSSARPSASVRTASSSKRRSAG